MIKLSYIIPTYKRPELLGQTLSSLSKQNLSPESFEVIVVENDSSLHLHSIIKKYSKTIKNVKHVLECNIGLHYARNRGIKTARGKYICFLDDDVILAPTHGSSIIYTFETHDQVVLIGGKVIPLFQGSVPQWITQLWRRNFRGIRILDALSLVDLGDRARVINPFYVFGCNFAIRKITLARSPGFSPDTFPADKIKFQGDGETAISRYIDANGMTAYYHPDCSVQHIVTKERLSPQYYYERAYRQGITDSFSDWRSKRPILMIGKRLLIRLVGLLSVLPYFNSVLISYYVHFARGYTFHLLSYLRDPTVRSWVHQETYN